MKNRIRLTLALALLCAAVSTAAASDSAYLYLLQGVPGRDYTSTTDPAMPVDVLLNGATCYTKGLDYGTIFGPLTLAPGSYDVQISLANATAPCTNPALVEGTVQLSSGQNVSAVLGLSSTGIPELMTFTNKFSSVNASDGRVLLAQAANAPALTVTFQNTTTMKQYTYTVNPGALLDENFTAGTYTVTISDGTTTLVPATTLELSSQSVTMLFTTGSASNNTINLETKTVKDVI
jgi:hypothetical protein